MLFETDGVNMLVKEPFEWITNLGGKTNSPNGPQTPLHCKPHSKRPQPSAEAGIFTIGSSRAYNCLIPISSLEMLVSETKSEKDWPSA